MISVLGLLIIPPVLWLICYMLGSILFLKEKSSFSEKLGIGFLTILALFQIVALPFMYYETNFFSLYILCIFTALLLCVIFVVLLIKKQIVIPIISELKELKKKCTVKKILIWCSIVGLIVLHIFLILYFQHSDPDDAYYLAQTNTILDTNYILNVEPSTGIENFEGMATTPAYKLVGYEVLIAVIAKVFHVNVAFLCHMIFPLFLIPIHYVIVYELAKLIDINNKDIFLLLCIFVNLFSSWSGASASTFLSYKIWQGKAVLVSLILPALLIIFWKIYQEKRLSNKNLFILIVILWAGFCSTSVGLYLIPIAYFAYTVSFLFTYKDIKNSFRLCIPIIICLPFVIVKLKVLLAQSFLSNVDKLGASSYFSSLFSKYLKGLQSSEPNYMFAVFFIIAIIYIWKQGNKIEKMVCVYSPIVLFLTFINPVFFPIVSNYITGNAVYWRLFWLPQFRYIVVIALILYISKDYERKAASILITILLISGSGGFLFKEPYFHERTNRYKLSDRVVWIADKIIAENDKNNNYLLIPGYYSYEVRQYTGKVRLVWGRYADSCYEEEDYKLLELLYNQLYELKVWNPEVLKKRLEYFHVNYVYIPDDALHYNEVPENLEKFYKKDEYTVFKVIQD